MFFYKMPISFQICDVIQNGFEIEIRWSLDLIGMKL